jgi:hypothetical protein
MNLHIAAILAADIKDQRDWSVQTFGPGNRTEGIIDHIKKELDEIRQEPDDLEEWIDVLILAIDGAHRTGATPVEILDMYHQKMNKNRARKWPDWRNSTEKVAIEHVRNYETDEGFKGSVVEKVGEVPVLHSDSCTPVNRAEGWYPADCKRCEETSKLLHDAVLSDALEELHHIRGED